MKKTILAIVASIVPVALVLWAGMNTNIPTCFAASVALATVIFYAKREEKPLRGFITAGGFMGAMATFFIALCVFLHCREEECSLCEISRENVQLFCGAVMYMALFWRFGLYTSRDTISKKCYTILAFLSEMLLDGAILGLVYTTCTRGWFFLGLGFIIGVRLARAIKK